ncbi:MAG: hypothetical protein EP344_09575 [Bacteroidetes bacterium]|nr:MAG: hypothetical protein EP344_09575 [Bacteroidota bacterium]
MKTKLFFTLFVFGAFSFALFAQDGTSSSGIKYETLKPGQGTTLSDGKEYYLHIDVSGPDGSDIFTTREMNVPFHGTVGKEMDKESVALDEVMKKMQQGGKYRVQVPKDLLSDKSQADALNGDHIVYEMEILSVSDARPNGADAVKEVISTQGIDAARAKFKALKSDATYVFAEWDMNAAGYDMLKAGKTDAAVELFKMNTELNTSSWNAYDSLGDGYLAKGDKANAKAAFEQALKLNSSYAPSQDKLNKL